MDNSYFEGLAKKCLEDAIKKIAYEMVESRYVSSLRSDLEKIMIARVENILNTDPEIHKKMRDAIISAIGKIK